MWVKHEKRLALPTRRDPAVSGYFRVWGERLPVADKLRTDRADRRDRGVGQNTSGTLQLFLAVSACGSRSTTAKSVLHHAKQDDEKTSTIFRKICKTQTAQKQGNTVLNRRKAKPSTSRKSKETAQSCGFSDFGGGEWIRTTEVIDNRFTVCPLWPLGNSPINYAILYKACPAFLSGRTAQFGAGERTRTPDLLITNSVGSVH